VYNEVVSEEAFPGDVVVMVTAQDADNDEHARVTYGIQSGNERGSFGIISQMGSGMISVMKPLSYKQQSRYVLVVTATDSMHTDTALVYVNISDANLHRPVKYNTMCNCQS